MRVSVCLGAILIPEYLDFHSGYSTARSRIAGIYSGINSYSGISQTNAPLEAYNTTNPFHKNKYSNFAEIKSQVQQVILEFTTFIEVNNEIKIRAVDVKRFGDDGATNHSV